LTRSQDKDNSKVKGRAVKGDGEAATAYVKTAEVAGSAVSQTPEDIIKAAVARTTKNRDAEASFRPASPPVKRDGLLAFESAASALLISRCH